MADLSSPATSPEDAAFEQYSDSVAFHVDAAGELTEAYGYGAGKLKIR